MQRRTVSCLKQGLDYKSISTAIEGCVGVLMLPAQCHALLTSQLGMIHCSLHGLCYSLLVSNLTSENLIEG